MPNSAQFDAKTMAQNAKPGAAPGVHVGKRRQINVLAYVHLRNIYGSTGAGRVARQMTEHLAERSDTDVQILADPQDHARIIPLVGHPWESYSYHFLESETSYQQAKWMLLKRPLAENYWPEAQIVYCTAESYVPTKRARLVVTLHDAAYLEASAHRHSLSFEMQRAKWKMLYRRLVREADLVQTVSCFSASRLLHFLPDLRSRVVVVHNAVTSMFFGPATLTGLAYLTRIGLSDKPFILVPGGLHFRKNADLILEAWPNIRCQYPDLKLAVVNHSDSEYAIKAQALGDSIYLLGFVPDESLKALYSAARVVWFPSRYEGFGLPVIEAMASGAPVVASSASSLPEIAGDAALLASPTNAGEHVDAIGRILSDHALTEELRRKGRERAAEFTWTKAAGKLRTHFEALL